MKKYEQIYDKMDKTKDFMKKTVDLRDYQPMRRWRPDVLHDGRITSRHPFGSLQGLTWNCATMKKIKPTSIRGTHPLLLPGKEKLDTREKDWMANMKKSRSMPSFDSKHHLTLQ